MHNDGTPRPKIAIIDPNTLSALGLKNILQNVMPIMTVDTYGSFSELAANDPDGYFHYFTAMNIVLENMSFFQEHRRKTIVLTLSLDTMSQLSDFKCLSTNVPEAELVRSILSLHLTLSRGAGTLSGGEAQRIRLATQIGSALMP